MRALGLAAALAVAAAGGGGAGVIVTFDSFAPLAQHHGALSRVLGRAGYLWRPRARRPRGETDFAVLDLDVSVPYTALCRDCAGCVRIDANRQIRGSLLSAPPKPLRRASNESLTQDLKRRSFYFAEAPPPRANRVGRHMEEVRQLDQIGARDGDAKSLYKRIVAPGMEALPLHARGFTGAGANVAVFDTGLRLGHEHFPKPPVERARRRHLLESEARGVDIRRGINWTSEPSRADTMGHGTFVASLVGGEFAVCPGFAPGAKLHVHKVFTNYQVSFTSWFLDAFNYIMLRGDIDVINLSVGGPDFADAPFVEKVRQVVASGIAVVSAMGNDGPLWGTLNSPGDMPETIGVGGSEADSGAVAKFSSRGATLFERSHGGSGLFKPDVTAPAAGVLGSLVDGTGCRAMHGTSVASPSVAGLATLVAAAYRDAMKQRGLPHKRNPAMIKQCVTGTANRYRPRADLQNAHDAASVLAQGAGRVNASAAVACAMAYPARGRVSVAPAALHLDDCPYFWPWCAQPLYGGARPITLNLTLTNGADVLSYLKRAAFIPSDAHSRQWLRVAVDDDLVKQRTKLWPWGGSVGMSVAVDKAAYDFEGRLSGVLRLWVGGPRARNACGADDDGEDGELHLVDVPVRVGVVKRPPREKRLLWDMGHSIAYPPAYIPRDTLGVDADLLDWNGDEPTTNFQNAFRKLRAAGYYVDVLRGGYECFDAAEYGALLVVDSEDEFAAAEIGKISKDVRDKGLGLFVVADWHDPKLVEEVHFFDVASSVEFDDALLTTCPSLGKPPRDVPPALGEHASRMVRGRRRRQRPRASPSKPDLLCL